MINARNGQTSQQAGQQTDKWEFRLLLSVGVACFFAVSLLTRVLPRSLRPFAAPDRRESCYEEARRVAYAVIPYAFEW